MNEVLKNMAERRSVRLYSKEQVSEDILKTILEAASFSPNAGNRQTTRIAVCQKEEINDTLGKIHHLLFLKYKHSKVGEPVLLEEGDLDQPELTSSFHSAPTVITLFGPKNFLFADADCYIMANNICLAANSLGVGSCIIGVVADIFQNEYGKELLRNWNIPENFRACTHIAMGYPAKGFPIPKPRTYPEYIIVN
jgi:Nitroreductase